MGGWLKTADFQWNDTRMTMLTYSNHFIFSNKYIQSNAIIFLPCEALNK